MQKPSDPTSSAEDSPVRTSRPPAREPVWRGSAPAFGGSTQGSFASYDPDSSSWKTFQLCLGGASETYSETWPRAGTMRSGTAFQRQPSAPLTAVTGSSWSRRWQTPQVADSRTNSHNTGSNRRDKTESSLGSQALKHWPTPTSKLGDARRGFPSAATGASRLAEGRRNLDDAAATMWPTATATATATDAKASGAAKYSTESGRHSGTTLTDATCRSGRPLPTTCTHGGECKPTLNPRFVEWLQGFPIGHTDLEP